ncbi:unnamed protein product [Allacma fusca]|uniref:C2H2-type domain-containing protein n=1 Tax=Allacma fusca TaxID=39272 RepID=A0A8J2JR03_9HEXA|nr:unnamed protein product [Allacma fusca]
MTVKEIQSIPNESNNSNSIKDSELCRYCTKNLTSLSSVYHKILKVASDSGSVFSTILLKEDPLVKSDINSLVPEFVDGDVFHENYPDFPDDFDPDSEEAPLGLQYLGLTRKKRTITNDDGTEAKRSRELVNIDLLFPEVHMTGTSEDHSNALDSSKSNSVSNNAAPVGPAPSIRCPYCKKTFRHPQRLGQHLKIYHQSKELSEGSSGSKILDKKATTKLLLLKKRGRQPVKTPQGKINSAKDVKKIGKKKNCEKEKIKPKTVDSEYTCKICSKKFKHLKFLNQHVKVHSNDRRCSKCEKKFKSSALLKRHMQVHNKNNNSAFKCEDCGREFPNLLGLQVHAVAHTRTLYTCKGCKRKFKIEKNFIQHQETARCTEKKHPCPTCGKLFKNKDKVKRHLISMHSETKPFCCDLCGKGFRSQADLKFHEVNAHICGETKEYQCDQCGKRFKSMETLKSHEMYSHKMEKKHFCATCGKGFPLLATLKIHEVSHSTDRPYMCTYCGRTYKHANDLKSHEVVHYKDEEKPFMCPICGNRYHRKDVLRLHQARDKHFGPDVPTPPSVKKTVSVNRGRQANKLSSMVVTDENEFESEDSSVNVPQVLPQPGPSGISVIPTTTSHIIGHEFPNSQLNPVLLTPHLSNHTNNLIPIVHAPSGNSSNSHIQQLNPIPQSTFTVPIVQANEAISDFYRIMYDLT